MTPYGHKISESTLAQVMAWCHQATSHYLSQCWLRFVIPNGIWRHQAITWTNVDLSSVRSSDIHLRASSQEIPQPSITEIIRKIKYLKFHSNFPGANELIHKMSLKILLSKLQPHLSGTNELYRKISRPQKVAKNFAYNIFKYIFLNETIISL